VNNSIGFPAIFRGTLDVKARTITDEMCIAAAYELAKFAEEQGLTDEHIVPSMADTEVFVREAVAVGMKAIEQGVAREVMTREELTKVSGKMIRDARKTVETLMSTAMIPPAPQGY
jgi:malate dehydrogenase (oxaloacetate-decarboxylating)